MKGPSVAIPGKALLNKLRSMSLESLGLGARAGDWGGVALGAAVRACTEILTGFCGSPPCTALAPRER